ncbi:MAG TPA: hypothetical protein PLF13_08430 [candidate division Zixibacteria bacterium]|nr:hypothetical protein [candidate division Zixibacteria bacterium]
MALSVAGAYAQADIPDTVASLPGIEIHTSVDKAECYIGDRVEYTLSIVYDSTYELVPPPLGANLGGFEIKDYQADVITRLDDGRIRSDNKFIVSTFTTGDYVIPPIPVLFTLPDSTHKVVLSEAVPIKVLSLLENASDTADIRPLKAPYEFERDLKLYYYGGGALLLLLLLLIPLLIWLRSRRRQAEPVDPRKPWEIAFESLAQLQNSNLLTEQRFKQYYVELTEIVRGYLGVMYLRDVLEMTTEQFLDTFLQVPMPGDIYPRCAEFLKHADLVKFAKHEPGLERAEQDLSEAHDIVEAVRADYMRRQAPQTVNEQDEPKGVA